MEALRLSIPLLPNRGLVQTLHLWDVPKEAAVVWSVLKTRLSAVLVVGVNSSVGETCCLLVVIQPWLLGRTVRTTGASGSGDLQLSLMVGRTSARNACSQRKTPGTIYLHPVLVVVPRWVVVLDASADEGKIFANGPD